MGSNKQSGSQFEEAFAQVLSDNGWWVHLLQQSKAGQPADIIASKGSRSVLIDCKDCQSGRFKLDRIEPNQETAMALWEARTSFKAWFAMRNTDGNVYMMRYTNLLMLRKNGVGSVIVCVGRPLQQWLGDMEC